MQACKKINIILFLIFVIVFFNGCTASTSYEVNKTTTGSYEKNELSTDKMKSSPEPSGSLKLQKPDDDVMLYEAEDGRLIGFTFFSETNPLGSKKISGDGYVGIEEKTDSIAGKLIFDVKVSKESLYELTFLTASPNGVKYNSIIVNNQKYHNAIHTDSEDFEPSKVIVRLNNGLNQIVINESWGWIYIDYMFIGITDISEAKSRSVYDVEKNLINENASVSTKRLMSYLVDQYGDYTLAGQYQDKGGINSKEIRAIYEKIGKYPAIMGFDFMDYSPSRVAYGASSFDTLDAIKWHELGGIVTFIWHWNAPKDLINSKKSPWWKGFYTKSTNFDLNSALNGEDPEGYELILRDIDAISEELKILKNNYIPVLWRPLHEAAGGWFWWGAFGKENFIRLWVLMYERMTYTHELDNLIWIYNGEFADWYPGDEYVDIISEDIYAPSYDYSSQLQRFELAGTYTDTNKIIALSENGVIPDPDLMYADNACWSFFATWSELFVIDDEGRLTDDYTKIEQLIKVYNHQRIITLDELPDFTEYPLR